MRRLGVPILASVVVAFACGTALAAAGDLDLTFSGDGIVRTVFSGGASANAVALQEDGKIVAVGSTPGPSGTGEFAVARYLTDGTLDVGFDADGRLTTGIAGGTDDAAHSVAIQADGKIVVAGTDSDERFAVVRYLTDGSLDPAFGQGGIATTNLTRRHDVGYGVAIQPDGKILVAGGAASDHRFGVVRYLPTGDRDATFGTNGKVVAVRGGTARAMALQPDGKIVVAGYVPFGAAVARFRVGGRLDSSFGRDGVANRGLADSFPLAIALQPNGKIVIGGNLYDVSACLLIRLRSDGRPDTSFAGDGEKMVSFGTGLQSITVIAVQPNRKILASGYLGLATGVVVPSIGVARVYHDGHRDRGWGGDGVIVTTFLDGVSANGAVQQSDDRLVVAGWARRDTTMGFALARYDTTS